MNSGSEWEIPKSIELAPRTPNPPAEPPKEGIKKDAGVKGVEIKVPIPVNTQVPPTGIVLGTAAIPDPWEAPKVTKGKARFQFGTSSPSSSK